MFTYLTEAGYLVVYKRPTNRESDFTIDQNELSAAMMQQDITANVNGELITDRQLPSMMENVVLFDELWKNNSKFRKYSYNEFQLKLMANCENFISVCGGNGILSSLFGGTLVMYVTQGTDVIPVFDVIDELNNVEQAEEFGHHINRTGQNDYSGLLKTIRETF